MLNSGAETCQIDSNCVISIDRFEVRPQKHPHLDWHNLIPSARTRLRPQGIRQILLGATDCQGKLSLGRHENFMRTSSELHESHMGSQWVPNGSHTIRSSDRSPASRMRSQNKVRAECIAAMATGHKTAFAPQRFNKTSLRSILCGPFAARMFT